MTRTGSLSFILAAVMLAGILPLSVHSGPSGSVLAQEAEPGTPEASPTAASGELGPVFATDEWRVSVVGAVHASGVNAVGLRRGEGKDWVVVVADVVNMGDDTSTLDLESFLLRFDGKRVKGFVPRSTASVARRLDAEPADAEAGVTINAGEIARVVWVYRVAEDLENPEFTRGDEAIPLSNDLLDRTDLRALPPVAPPLSLQPIDVDSVIDGATISVFDSETETSMTIVLAGVDAPLEDECYGGESADQLDDLVSDTIWLEVPSGQPTSQESGDGSDEPLIGFVWAERDGTKVLLNEGMIAEGGAALGDLGGDVRYRDWLTSSEATARANAIGLWAVCSGPHGDALPTPTPPPPTPTPEPEGTRDNPVPVGKSAKVGDWSLKVVDVIPNGTDAVMAENQFNDPPAEGRQFFLVTVAATFEGSGSSTFIYDVQLSAVGASAVAYSYQDSCGVVPNELSSQEVFEGGEITGNICWSVKSDDVDSLVMFADFGFSRDNRVYFSLQRD